MNPSDMICHLRVAQGKEVIRVWGRSDSQGMRLHIGMKQPFGIAIDPWHKDTDLLPTAPSLHIHPQPGSFPHCSGMKNSSWSWSLAKTLSHTLRLGSRRRISLWRDISQDPATFQHLLMSCWSKGYWFLYYVCAIKIKRIPELLAP